MKKQTPKELLKIKKKKKKKDYQKKPMGMWLLTEAT